MLLASALGAQPLEAGEDTGARSGFVEVNGARLYYDHRHDRARRVFPCRRFADGLPTLGGRTLEQRNEAPSAFVIVSDERRSSGRRANQGMRPSEGTRKVVA
jgi:hypothetical protein